MTLEDGTGGEQGGFTGSPSHKSVVTAAHRTTTLAFARFTPCEGRGSGEGGQPENVQETKATKTPLQ